MNAFDLRSLSMAVVSIALASCGGGGSGNESATTSANGSRALASELGAREPAPLRGGALAQAIVDETAATTNARNGVIAGSPLPLPSLEDEPDFAVPPPSIGADVPVTYFGPAPSSVNKNLIGPLLLLTAGRVDLNATPRATVTLPLYKGRLASGGPRDGATFWYIVTDTSDKANAAALGLNFSAKLAFSDVPAAMQQRVMSTTVRKGYYEADGTLVTTGGPVDFSPQRLVSQSSTATSGTSNLLQNLTARAGAVGAGNGDPDGFYSPLVQIANAGNHVYNAPLVSFGTSAADLAPFCTGITDSTRAQAGAILHDAVVGICPGDNGEPGTVTLNLANGFSFGRPVLYLSTDASAEPTAALEGVIFAPALGNIPVGRDDSLFSAIERIFVWTNGPTNNVAGEVNPQRQGLNSAILGEGGPVNVLGGIPTIATDYSPLWDLNLGEWTQEAVDKGYRSRMTEEFAILGMVQRGFLTGPGGSRYGSTGVIINCPIVQRLL